MLSVLQLLNSEKLNSRFTGDNGCWPNQRKPVLVAGFLMRVWEEVPLDLKIAIV